MAFLLPSSHASAVPVLALNWLSWHLSVAESPRERFHSAPKRFGRLSHCVCWLGWSGLRSSRRPEVFPPVFSWKLSPSCLLGHIIPCRYQFSGRTPGPTASQVLGWVGTPTIPQSNSGAHSIQTTALGIAKSWPQSLSFLTHILTGIPL